MPASPAPFLHLPLLFREARGVRLTPPGEAFLHHAREVLREAEKQDIVITRRGKPAGVLIGFSSEDDWFDYKLKHDSRFLQRIARARE